MVRYYQIYGSVITRTPHSLLGTHETLLALLLNTFDQFLVLFSMIIFPPLHRCLSEKEVQLKCLFNGEIACRFFLVCFPPSLDFPPLL